MPVAMRATMAAVANANVSRAAGAVRMVAHAPKACSSRALATTSIPATTKARKSAENTGWATRERAHFFCAIRSAPRRRWNERRLQCRNEARAFALGRDCAIDLFGRFHDVDAGKRERQRRADPFPGQCRAQEPPAGEGWHEQRLAPRDRRE